MGQILSRSSQNNDIDHNHIFRAVEKGNLHQLKRYMDPISVEEIQAIRKDGKTLLHHAVYYHKLDCVRFLLEIGIDANILDDFGNAPLLEILNKAQDNVCIAAHNPQCLEMLVNVLLKFKADINARSSVHRTALLKSIIHRHRLSEVLLKNGADPNISDEDGLLPIHVCATYSCLSLLKQIIAAGADLNGKDSKERTALYFSVLAGHQRVFDELIRNGCDINIESRHGFPLQTAIMKCRLEMVKTLLKKGVDVQCKIHENRDPYYRVSDYLNMALLAAHSHITNTGIPLDKESAIEKAKCSLQILYLIIQAFGQVGNFTKSAFIKTRRPSLEGVEVIQCKRLVIQILQMLAFLRSMNRLSKQLDGLPKLGSDIDTLSLQNISRMKVRNIIAQTGTNVIFVVERLEFPSVLKDFILLRDIV